MKYIGVVTKVRRKPESRYFLDRLYRFVTEKKCTMGRKPKHPEHKEQAKILMNVLLDSLVSLWTSEEDPQLNTVSEELEMSAAKVRKLLITAGIRDGEAYYSSPMADHVLRLWKEKKSIKEIAVETGRSTSSITGYLPHSKTIYSLDTLSTEAERIKLFRSRKAAVEELQNHINLPDVSEYLWKCICLFESYPFQTFGRGKEHKNATKFRYTVTRSAGAGGRHYAGADVPGYGNEIWIEGKEKSISRSTVDLAYRNARDEQERCGFVSGPRKLGVPGSRSYLYPMFLRFGVITSEA